MMRSAQSTQGMDQNPEQEKSHLVPGGSTGLAFQESSSILTHPRFTWAMFKQELSVENANPQHIGYPLVISNSLLLKMTIEIMDLPINSMVIFHRFLYVYQAG